MIPGSIDNLALDLIRRSTGPLGDFKMPVCSNIIQNENLGGSLGQDGVMQILRRYKQHTSFWGIGLGTVTAELARFAQALRWDYNLIYQLYLQS
jgi:hypothetical protein